MNNLSLEENQEVVKDLCAEMGKVLNTDTLFSSSSFAPTTSIYGTLARRASRILYPIFSERWSTDQRIPFSFNSASTFAPGGQFVVHRICRVHADGYNIIGDAQTEIEHHVQRKQIFARVTKVERKGKILVPGTFWWEFFAQVWIRIIPLRPILMHGYARLFGVDKKKNDACRENERKRR